MNADQTRLLTRFGSCGTSVNHLKNRYILVRCADYLASSPMER